MHPFFAHCGPVYLVLLLLLTTAVAGDYYSVPPECSQCTPVTLFSTALDSGLVKPPQAPSSTTTLPPQVSSAGPLRFTPTLITSVIPPPPPPASSAGPLKSAPALIPTAAPLPPPQRGTTTSGTVAVLPTFAPGPLQSVPPGNPVLPPVPSPPPPVVGQPPLVQSAPISSQTPEGSAPADVPQLPVVTPTPTLGIVSPPLPNISSPVAPPPGHGVSSLIAPPPAPSVSSLVTPAGPGVSAPLANGTTITVLPSATTSQPLQVSVAAAHRDAVKVGKSVVMGIAGLVLTWV